jgi:bla regulator protein blaR1
MALTHMSPVRLLYVLTAFVALALPAAANRPRGVSPGKETTFIYMRDSDTIMSGNLEDLERVKKVMTKRERVLWFRTIDGKELVVRDAAFLDQFEDAWKPADALAQKQGALGSKQGALGAQQGALGAKQGAIGARQGILATRQAVLEQREETARTDAQREALVKKRRAIEAQMRELEKKSDALDEQMHELDKPMRVLEKEMEILSKKHEVAAKQAQLDSEALFARAIASGIAKPF